MTSNDDHWFIDDHDESDESVMRWIRDESEMNQRWIWDDESLNHDDDHHDRFMTVMVMVTYGNLSYETYDDKDSDQVHNDEYNDS